MDIKPPPSMPAGESGAGDSSVRAGTLRRIVASPMVSFDILRRIRSTWVGTFSPR